MDLNQIIVLLTSTLKTQWFLIVRDGLSIVKVNDGTQIALMVTLRLKLRSMELKLIILKCEKNRKVTSFAKSRR